MDAREAWNDGEVEPVGDYVIVEYVNWMDEFAKAPVPVKVRGAPRGSDLLRGDVVVIAALPMRVADGLGAVPFSSVIARVSQEVQGEDRILLGPGARPGFMVPIPASAREFIGDESVELILPCAFRGEQIVLDPASASYFDIGYIIVGQRNQTGFGDIPCSVFMPQPGCPFINGRFSLEETVGPRDFASENAPRVKLSLGQSGEKIVFGLECKSERPRRFGGGVLVGTAVW